MYRILCLPGDGIGKEVVPAARSVVDAASERAGIGLAWTVKPCGAEYYLESGVTIDADVRAALPASDAIFLGAVGLPSVRRPDGGEVADEVVLDIRSDLDLYANLRPVRSWPGVRGPLGRQDIDYTILRENTEGLYASRTGGLVLGDNVATDTMIITRRGTERAADHAFQFAQRSKGRPRDGRKVVTCADKANTLKSFVFFRKIFDEVAARYPEVQTEYELADAMTARMVLAPDTLNVVVCENMLGDLLSDLAAATVGGMGLAPSANVGLRHGMFEPTHGSAPGIAGRNQANPIAAILSGAMMLQWLGDRSNDDKCVSAARNIKSAVEKTLAAGMKTNDLGGTETTSGFATAVIANLEVG